MNTGLRIVVMGGAGSSARTCVSAWSTTVTRSSASSTSTRSSGNVAHLVPELNFDLVRTDVTDYVHIVGDVDAVLNFASPASPIDYLRLPIHTLKVGSIETFAAWGWLGRRAPASFSASRQRGTATHTDSPTERELLGEPITVAGDGAQRWSICSSTTSSTAPLV